MRRIFRKFAKWVGAQYDGAVITYLRGWRNTAVNPAHIELTKATRTTLVGKSLDFERNDGLYNRLCDVFECYTVGTGLPLIPSSDSSTWNEKALESLKQWSKFCDFTGRQSLSMLQGLWARTWFVWGEVFILLTSGEGADGKRRPRLQTIEGDRICSPPKKVMEDNHLVEDYNLFDGVQVDLSGRTLGFWMRTVLPDKKEQWEFIDRAKMIHLFEPSRAGQYRGLPFCHAVINDIQDLHELQELEMSAAKDAAKTSKVIETATGEISDEEAIRRGAAAVTDTGASRDHYKQVFGSETEVIRTGDKYNQYVSNRPSVAVQWFWKDLREKICNGHGIPYILVCPESMQGTVYRGALDMANAFFRARFQTMSSVCERVYVFWAMWAKSNEPALRDAPGSWDAVSISPPRAVNVDVGRNSSAMLSELEVGATNYELMYAPLGLDWREQFRKLKEQKDYADSIGLELNPAAGEPIPITQDA